MPHTRQSLVALIDRCSYPGFAFDFSDDGPKLRVRCLDGVCNRTGNHMEWKGRWWHLSYHMVDGEVVQTIFLAVKTALEHEARERFTFDGAAVFDSHFDIHKLTALRKQTDAIVERTAPPSQAVVDDDEIFPVFADTV